MTELTSHRLDVNACQATIAVDPDSATVIRAGPLERILSFDESLLVSFRRFRAPWRTALARALTRAGDGTSWVILGLACLATMTPRGIHLGLRLGAATGLATLVSQALKRSLTRPRPSASIEGFQALTVNPDAFSFPSGHTSAAFAVAVAFAGEPYGIGPGALLLAIGIALARVYLGAHYPLDVSAGAVLGLFGGLASRLLVS